MTETVVVTGGSSGIGSALVKRFVDDGYHVASIDLNQDILKTVKSPNVLSLVADVTSTTDMEKAAETLTAKWGAPFLWINNAGIAKLGTFSSINADDFDRVMNVNFRGVVVGTRLAMKLMNDPPRGVIVNVASLNGVIAAPFMSSYVASKHAVVGFTRAIQLELKYAHSPIRMVLALPGFVKTPIIESHGEFQLPAWATRLAAEPDDIARAIVRGVESGTDEIIAPHHGRLLNRLGQFLPRLASHSSRLLVAKNWRELLGLDPIERD